MAESRVTKVSESQVTKVSESQVTKVKIDGLEVEISNLFVSAMSILKEKKDNMLKYLGQKREEHSDNDALKIVFENLSNLSGELEVCIFTEHFLMQFYQQRQDDVHKTLEWYLNRTALQEYQINARKQIITQMLHSGMLKDDQALTMESNILPTDVQERLFDYFECFCAIVQSMKEECE